MNASAAVLRQDFDAALDAARGIVLGADLPGLSAPLNVQLAGLVSRVWDRIEHALDVAFTYGRDHVQEVLQGALAGVEELLREAGERAADAQQALLIRMQTYTRTLVDRALAQLRPTVLVGPEIFALNGIELAQTLTMTGSLKTNLLEMVTLTAEGELSVTATYARPVR